MTPRLLEIMERLAQLPAADQERWAAQISTLLNRSEGEPTLEELLARITPENLHPETDWGPPVGREVW